MRALSGNQIFPRLYIADWKVPTDDKLTPICPRTCIKKNQEDTRFAEVPVRFFLKENYAIFFKSKLLATLLMEISNRNPLSPLPFRRHTLFSVSKSQKSYPSYMTTWKVPTDDKEIIRVPKY